MKPDLQDLQGRGLLKGRSRWQTAIGIGVVVTIVFLLMLWLLSDSGTRHESKEGNPRPVLAAGELIAFVRAGPGQNLLPGDVSVLNDPDIFTLGSNGRASNLTKDPAALESNPAWSPDGRRIVFSRAVPGPSRPPQYELYIARSDGSEAKPLTHCGGGSCRDWDPEWSPDGHTIVFHRSREGGKTGIYTIGSRGGRARLVKSTSSLGGLSWSPDGETIVYSSAGARFRLFLMDSDGSNTRALLARPLEGCQPRTCPGYWAPAWSPDGSWIAFVSCCGEPEESDLYVIRPDGTGLRLLADCPEECQGAFDSPTWSPDSSRIAVVDRVGIRGRLVLIRVRDGTQRTLTQSQRVDCCPTFRPTGS